MGNERERKGGEGNDKGRGKVGKGNLPPLKFRSGYATDERIQIFKPR